MGKEERRRDVTVRIYADNTKELTEHISMAKGHYAVFYGLQVRNHISRVRLIRYLCLHVLEMAVLYSHECATVQFRLDDNDAPYLKAKLGQLASHGAGVCLGRLCGRRTGKRQAALLRKLRQHNHKHGVAGAD